MHLNNGDMTLNSASFKNISFDLLNYDNKQRISFILPTVIYCKAKSNV